MLTIHLSLTASGDGRDLSEDYESKQDLIDAIQAHITYALDRLDLTDVTYTVLEVEGH